MFGYVRTMRAELRVREYEYYRASYCGLCRSMGKCTGQCSRLTLSYDFAFLANVRMAISGTGPTFRRRRCVAHPFHKRMMMERNAELDYCADAAAILNYEKCRDDVADESGFRRFRARVRCFLLHRAMRRAAGRHGALAAAVRETLAELAACERAGVASVDAPAALFGKLLAAVAAEGYEGEAARIAAAVGDRVGRFIYIVDAADDAEDDAAKKRFNPFLLLYGNGWNGDARAEVKDALIAGLVDLETVFDLLPADTVPERREVLRNILYLGMPATVREVLDREKNARKEDKREQQSI